jgi:hypothetical protein
MTTKGGEQMEGTSERGHYSKFCGMRTLNFPKVDNPEVSNMKKVIALFRAT